MWIIVEGDFISGLSFYGPFDTREEAESFANTCIIYNQIVKLEPPLKDGGS